MQSMGGSSKSTYLKPPKTFISSVPKSNHLNTLLHLMSPGLSWDRMGQCMQEDVIVWQGKFLSIEDFINNSKTLDSYNIFAIYFHAWEYLSGVGQDKGELSPKKISIFGRNLDVL